MHSTGCAPRSCKRLGGCCSPGHSRSPARAIRPTRSWRALTTPIRLRTGSMASPWMVASLAGCATKGLPAGQLAGTRWHLACIQSMDDRPGAVHPAGPSRHTPEFGYMAMSRCAGTEIAARPHGWSKRPSGQSDFVDPDCCSVPWPAHVPCAHQKHWLQFGSVAPPTSAAPSLNRTGRQ